MKPRQQILAVLAILGTVALSGCAGPPEPPEPTVVELTLRAALDINPSRDGRPSPVVVHVYQLQSLTTFNEADFFQLSDQAAATLESALVAQEELVLTPGETKTIVREFKPEGRFLGVLVSYRDIDHAIWRASAQVPPNQKSALEARLIALTVTLVRGES